MCSVHRLDIMFLHVYNIVISAHRKDLRQEKGNLARLVFIVK